MFDITSYLPSVCSLKYIKNMTPSLTLAILAICCALAHGGHERAPTPHANDWASTHMAGQYRSVS